MPFCPECRDEYVETATRCPDCECDLVGSLDGIPEPVVPVEALPGADAEPAVVSRVPDEASVEGLLRLLRAASIPARAGDTDEEGTAIEVPEAFSSRAASLLRRVTRPGAAALDDEDLALLEAPIDSLRQDPARATEALTRLLVRGGDEAIVLRAAILLARLGGEGLETLRGALVESVAADSPVLRGAAVRALREGGVPEPPAGLVTLIDDPRVEVRTRALRTLGRLGSPEGLPAAVRCLRADDPEVREEAADVVWELSGGRIDLDFDEDPEQAEEALRALEERFGG